MKNILKNNKGITLIALVVTVVILLILASVTIGELTSKKGLINQANKNSFDAQKESIIEKIEAELYNEKVKTGKIQEKDKLIEIAKKYGKIEDESSGIIKIYDGDQEAYEISFSEIEGWKETEEYYAADRLVFDGTNYINTGIKLLSKKNIDKDFEITFTFIDCAYKYDEERLLSIRDESIEESPFFRVVLHDKNGKKFKVTTKDNPSPPSTQRLYLKANDQIKIKKYKNTIVFLQNNSLYTTYKINENEYSDAPLTLGAALDASGKPYKFFHGEIANIEVKFTECKEIKTADSYKVNGEVEFDGSNYLNTGLKLFSEENFDRDFEMSFEIVREYSNANQATIMNAKDEKATPWPGFLLRYYVKAQDIKYELSVTNNAKVMILIDREFPQKINMKRINRKFYYSINDGDFIETIDFSTIAWKFDVPVTFGASLDGNGNPQRLFKGTLKDISVRFIN